MSIDLYKLLDSVGDEDSFVRFLQALASDRADEVEKEKVQPSNPYGPGPNGWEQGTIEGFLDAAAAWAHDTSQGEMPLMPFYQKATNPWKRCAEILLAGKSYE